MNECDCELNRGKECLYPCDHAGEGCNNEFGGDYELLYKVDHKGNYELLMISPLSLYWEAMFYTITQDLRDIGEGMYKAYLVVYDEYTGDYEIEQVFYKGGWREI